MNLNIRLFFKINNLVGKSRFIDAFGRAGAEWAIIAVLGWYAASVFIEYLPSSRAVAWPLLFFGGSWILAWLISIAIGLIVKEPRPNISYPESKLLFTPTMSWKSFPSDHAMTSWLALFTALMFGLPGAWGLLPLAIWVSWGRIFAGLHYPFDIVGGVALAGLVAVIGFYARVVMI